MDPTDKKEPQVRMPGVLRPSYERLIRTPEGKAARKRIRVYCGVCLQTRYYSIYRGVTRIAGVVACEQCRHFYQGFNRRPLYADCTKQGRYGMARMTGCPLLQENVPDTARGGLGIEVYWDNSWVDVTDSNADAARRASKDSDDGFVHNLVMEDDPLIGELVVGDPAGWERVVTPDPPTGASDTVMTDPFGISSNLSENSVSRSPVLMENTTSNDTVTDPSDQGDVLRLHGTPVYHGYGSDLACGPHSSINLTMWQQSAVSDVPPIGACATVTSHSEDADVRNENSGDDRMSCAQQNTTTVDPCDRVMAVLMEELLVENLSENTQSPEVESQVEKKKKKRKKKKMKEKEEEEEDEDEEEWEVYNNNTVKSMQELRVNKQVVNDQLKVKQSPSNSLRGRRKRQTQFFHHSGSRRRYPRAVHGSDGRLVDSGKDLCDCLQGECPGCHFPCPSCGSGKCGIECRVNRTSYYEKVEAQGTQIRRRNEYVKKK